MSTESISRSRFDVAVDWLRPPLILALIVALVLAVQAGIRLSKVEATVELNAKTLETNKEQIAIIVQGIDRQNASLDRIVVLLSERE